MSTDVIVTPLYLDWIPRTAHALPVPDSQESDFMLERTAATRLHYIDRNEFSYWNENLPPPQLPG